MDSLTELLRRILHIERRVDRLESLETPTVGGGGVGAPNDAQYVTLALDAGLTAERVLTEGPDIDLVDGGANTTITVGRGGDTVLLFNSDGTPIEEFAATQAGVIAALAAAAAGNIIECPRAITIALTAGITIPASVTLRQAALSFSAFAGNAVTLAGASSRLEDSDITYDGAGQASATAVYANGVAAVLLRVNAFALNATTNIGISLRGAGASSNRLNVSNSYGNAQGGTTAIGIHIEDDVRGYWLIGEANGASAKNVGLQFEIDSLGADDYFEHGFSQALSTGAYGVEVVAAHYGRLLHYQVSGATKDILINAGAELQIFSVQYDSITNNGTLTQLPPSSGSGLGWFYVTDYGATGNGVTDDTAAIQATIDAAEAAGGGVVYFPRGVYIVGGALQDGARSNAQILLPILDTATDAQVTIHLLGESPPPPTASLLGTVVTPAGGSVIKGTLNAGAGGALIGAWGPVGSYQDFSMVHVKVENLTIRMPANPVLSALNFGKVVTTEICDVIVDTSSYDIDDIPEPTTNTSYGIVTPKNNNGAWTVLRNVTMIGFYYGIEINEHADADGLQFFACKYAGRFLQGNHASHIARMLVTWCESGLLFSGGAHYVDIFQYDVEHYSGAPPKWFDPLNDVDDTNDYMEGLIRWQAVLAGTGPENSFLVNGGANLQTIRITDDWGGGTTLVSSNDTTPGYLNGKLVAGTNVTLTENNDGGNETLTIAAPGGSDHIHGLMRWAADGGATVDLVDIAEYVEAISDDGSIVDPATYTLSADGSQVTFDAGPAAASVMTAQYVIARV